MTTITFGTAAQIDLHSHAVTEGYLTFIKEHHAEMDEGFPIPGWDAEKHLAFMDRAGIATSVLTMPAPQPWFGDGNEAAAACRQWNEECAMLKARHPGRFLFCAALPLPDVEAAIYEARYALDVLGADGIKLATEVGRTSMATEPGVLSLFSMQDKANPAKIYILEIYADSAAYQRHIQTPHFKKYKEGTAKMVRSLRLIDVDPLVEMRLKQH